MAGQEQHVVIDGHRVRLTSLDRIVYPLTGTTKGEVVGYYSAIAKTMLPHCAERPATRKRWPSGVAEDGKGAFFFQKDIGEGAPDWVATGDIQHKDHTNTYPLVNNEATLIWLAQLSALEIHVPQWQFSPSGVQNNPDRMVFDLDPGEGVDLRQCAEVAFLVRDILRGMHLESVPVTSGSKGIHLYAALDRTLTSEQVSQVAKELARSLEADYPHEITSSMKRSLRPGKVFIDWSQNSASKTTVAPYSLRGRARPTVAAPRTWRELSSPHLKHLEFDEVLKRVQKRGDPLADFAAQKTGSAHVPQVQGAGRDRLEIYRSKRNASRTPEPVPDKGDVTIDSDAEAHRSSQRALRFVIQRHEARRLHFDFRLEHDGVLVSWALPKGVPQDSQVNHLAVPTEDHPMSYRHFEGTIPKGEYGAGKVEIWDSGTYELEQWSDDEIKVILHGKKGGGLDGPKRLVLFRAGEAGGKPRWMIHLKQPDRAERSRRKQAVTPAPSTSDASNTPLDGDADYAPMLASAGNEQQLGRLDQQSWSFEMKWDGIRTLAHIENGRCVLRSRSGKDISAVYPEFAALAEVVHPETAVLDGEIVAIDKSGVPNFALLQQRFGLENARDVERSRRQVPASLLLFDVLCMNNLDCRELPYDQRRELLLSAVDASALSNSDAIVSAAVPTAFEGDATSALEASESLGLEGIVAKRRASPYLSGERSEDWLKFALFHTDEVVIVGWRQSESDAKGFASLLLAQPTQDQSTLTYAGRVGTGFSSAERRKIRQLLRPLQSQKPALEVPPEITRDACWVKPVLVGEVVAKGRTRSGYLRQPVWRGLRPDKSMH